jgi:uncharacterized membrane protein
LALVALPYAFSIDSYYTHATVMENGDIQVYENINFTLETAYNEGFRSIRKEDFDSLDRIAIQAVKVNGQDVTYTKQMNGDNAEIVWKKTYEGANNIELSYILKDRAQLYDDFAKVCFEHYGANWPVTTGTFRSQMTLPETARGKDMHFEVYSAKQGNAYIDDLSVMIEMTDVPSGNYIGGCYLYDKAALSTINIVNGSALQILQDEREAYGSKTIVASEDLGSSTCCCLPAAIITALIALFYLIRDIRAPKLPESILPPDKEEPAVVTTLVRNEMVEADVLAAAILDLINRNCMDIVELEKGKRSSTELNKERTILMLKKRPDNPKPYDNAIIDMLFANGRKEVDLDRMATEFAAIKTKEDAEKDGVSKGVETFNEEIEKILKGKGLWEYRNANKNKKTGLSLIVFFGLIASCAAIFVSFEFMTKYLATGNYLEVAGTGIALLVFFPSAIYAVIGYLKPSAPGVMREEYAKWDAFGRAVKASRLNEYPPSSAVIWGDILVYATALGMADRVKKHMSELDIITSKRLERMDIVRKSSIEFYVSAWALHNLRTYGNRYGPESSHGGFSSGSSGGWSSGGGGFSGGSSGGGGFR